MRGIVTLGMLFALWAVAPVSAAGAREEHRLLVNGVERWTTVYLPASYRPGAPVVLLLHGGTQSMRKILSEKSGGTRHWLTIAEREKFLLLIPNATNAETGDPKGDHQNWNDLRPAGITGKAAADDVGFLLHLLDWVQERYGTDPQKIFVTGASNGGMMTFRLLIEQPRRFAAAAAFIASLPAGVPAKPAHTTRVPLMLFNGTRDPLIQWNGGEIRGERGMTLAIEPMVAWWREVNGVDRATALTSTLPDRDSKDGCQIQRTEWPGVANGSARVVFYSAEGGGHALPSIAHPLKHGPVVRRLIGPVCRDAEGAELAWEFFKPYTRTP